MKIVFISDTHGQHDDLDIPDGDMLIHAGDISSRGRKEEVMDFLDWFTNQSHKYKIFIAGNHDFFFEKESTDTINKIMPTNIIYLNDNGIEIEGLKIWGSPVQPAFFNWAFNRQRGVDIKKHWDLIPKDTDILITHGPPLDMLDKTIEGSAVGCEELRLAVDLIQPSLHVFGHIHEDYGSLKIKNNTYINASVLNEKYYLTNDPVVVNL